jgi:hypothetical protein
MMTVFGYWSEFLFALWTPHSSLFPRRAALSQTTMPMLASCLQHVKRVPPGRTRRTHRESARKFKPKLQDHRMGARP